MASADVLGDSSEKCVIADVPGGLRGFDDQDSALVYLRSIKYLYESKRQPQGGSGVSVG